MEVIRWFDSSGRKNRGGVLMNKYYHKDSAIEITIYDGTNIEEFSKVVESNGGKILRDLECRLVLIDCELNEYKIVKGCGITNDYFFGFRLLKPEDMKDFVLASKFNYDSDDSYREYRMWASRD